MHIKAFLRTLTQTEIAQKIMCTPRSLIGGAGGIEDLTRLVISYSYDMKAVTKNKA